jgi:hypothetical protein
MKENDPGYLFSRCSDSRDEALKMGHKLYFGTDCRKGHADDIRGNRRYVSGRGCCACVRISDEARKMTCNGGPKPMGEIDDLKEDADLAAELAEVWD